MEKRSLLFIGTVLFLTLLALSSLGCREETSRIEQLDGLSAREALNLANAWRQEHPEVSSYVTSEKIVFEFPGDTTRSIELPPEEMVVSVAPYETETHTCSIHSISSCQGELTQTTFRVTAVDSSGRVVFEDNKTTMESGFFDLWLPKGKEILLTVAKGDKKAQQKIATREGSKTCLTTLKLRPAEAS